MSCVFARPDVTQSWPTQDELRLAPARWEDTLRRTASGGDRLERMARATVLIRRRHEVASHRKATNE